MVELSADADANLGDGAKEMSYCEYVAWSKRKDRVSLRIEFVCYRCKWAMRSIYRGIKSFNW